MYNNKILSYLLHFQIIIYNDIFTVVCALIYLY